MILPAIGELKDSIDIQNVTPPYNVDGTGTVVSTFRSGIRAKVVPLGGDMDALTQQIQVYRQNYNIWIRLIAGVTAFQQIAWGTKRLVMTAPPEEIGRWLLIHAQELQARKL